MDVVWMRLRRVNRDTKHILYSNMSGELKSVLEDGPIEGEPLVSVCVITYNHGKYIRQCLDGILMQKVNFPYEILIHDDASPDDTADIIREYWEKYSTVIKPILQTENQHSQGRSASKFNYDRAKAKYIALCEGDDYWTDDGKLQMQVDFLEEHGEYVGTAHSVCIVDIDGVPKERVKNWIVYDSDHVFSAECLNKRWLAGQTASLVYRNIFQTLSQDILEKYYACKSHGDRKLTVMLASLGEIQCFGNVMSHYRQVTHTGTSANAQVANKPPAKWQYFMEEAICEFARDAFNLTINPSHEYVRLSAAGILYFIMHPSAIALKDVMYVIWNGRVKITGIVAYMLPRMVSEYPKALFRKIKREFGT